MPTPMRRLLAAAVRAQTIEAVPAADAGRAQELLGATVLQQPFADALALHGIAMLATGDHSRAIESLTAAVETSWDEFTALWLARAHAAGRLSASARRLAESLRAVRTRRGATSSGTPAARRARGPG